MCNTLLVEQDFCFEIQSQVQLLIITEIFHLTYQLSCEILKL